MTRTDLLARAQQLRTARTPFVLATVVRAQRPTSAKAGDSALVLPDGTVDGFVGGTCAESTVRLQGLRLLATGESTLLRITPEPGDSARDAGAVADEGMVSVANPCLSGGSLEIFLEAMLPPPLVHVYGEAPVARALHRLGEALGYEMVASTDPHDAIHPDTSAVVVAAHGRLEEPVLRAALRADVPYVALVASRKRGAAVLAELDLAPEKTARVHSPAGIDLGTYGPPEVALSILAEIVASRATAPPGPAAGHEHGRPPGTGPTPVVTVTSAVDPVCGMEVAVLPGALRAEHAGREYYFCGPGCLSSFVAGPARYLP
jgi:xanthine dehydrogenase accessory factor